MCVVSLPYLLKIMKQNPLHAEQNIFVLNEKQANHNSRLPEKCTIPIPNPIRARQKYLPSMAAG